MEYIPPGRRSMSMGNDEGDEDADLSVGDKASLVLPAAFAAFTGLTGTRALKDPKMLAAAAGFGTIAIMLAMKAKGTDKSSATNKAVGWAFAIGAAFGLIDSLIVQK